MAHFGFRASRCLRVESLGFRLFAFQVVIPGFRVAGRVAGSDP